MLAAAVLFITRAEPPFGMSLTAHGIVTPYGILHSALRPDLLSFLGVITCFGDRLPNMA